MGSRAGVDGEPISRARCHDACSCLACGSILPLCTVPIWDISVLLHFVPSQISIFYTLTTTLANSGKVNFSLTVPEGHPVICNVKSKVCGYIVILESTC